MMLLAESHGEISERLAADLADVELRFAGEVASDLACVNQLVQHVERYRGKMLRPTLVLVTAMACRDDRPAAAHRALATVVEMVHMATLVHDDILDEADIRRRGATVNHLSGNETAVMLGDYLISHAYHLCSSLDRPDISRMIAAATNTVCEGELLQLANRFNYDLDEATYFQIIRRKTASLCGVSCGASALLAGMDAATCAALSGYGEQLGTAFQIIDDVLDLAGEESTVGKTLGRDLDKSKLTLPVIHGLATTEPAVRARLRRLLGEQAAQTADPGVRQELRERVHALLLGSGSIRYAREYAASMVEQAKAGVREHLPASPARDLMLTMADAVISRQF